MINPCFTCRFVCLYIVCVCMCVWRVNNATAQSINVWDGKEDEMKRRGRQCEKGSQQNTAAAASLQRLTTTGQREQNTHTHIEGKCCFEFFRKQIRSAGRQSMILRAALQNSTATALFQEANERCGVSVIVFLKPVSPPTHRLSVQRGGCNSILLFYSRGYN